MILKHSPSFIKLHFWCHKNFLLHRSFLVSYSWSFKMFVPYCPSFFDLIWPHYSQVIDFKPLSFQDLPPGSNLKFPSGNKECFTAEFFDFSFDTHFQFWFATYRSAIFFLSLRDSRIRFLDRPNILLKIFVFMSSAFFHPKLFLMFLDFFWTFYGNLKWIQGPFGE